VNFTSPRIIFYLVLFFYLPLQLYLFRRLERGLNASIRDPRRAKIYRRAAMGFFIFMFFPFLWIAIFGLLPQEPYPWPIRQDLLLLSIWALGSTGCAAVLLSYDFFKRSVRMLPWRSKVLDLERRRFLKIGAGAAAAAPFVLSGYGTLLGRRRFEIEHFELPVNGLSSALSQLTVVQLTDIHAGPFMPPEELAAYVEAVNRLKPDLIALTGDFVASKPNEAGPCAETLAGLRARYGVYSCLGNHDVYADIEDDLTRLFVERGIRMLRNDAISLQIKDTQLDILGIDDLRSGVPDLQRALGAAAKNPGEVRLLLSHRPEIFPFAAWRGIEVVLAGHYHGGQVKLVPESANLSIARFLTPYAEGLFHLSRRRLGNPPPAKDSTLFVGRGIGITGLPIRINCPPQIAHLTLKKV
jgi:predicted MPP superfamily phosphohydrolase